MKDKIVFENTGDRRYFPVKTSSVGVANLAHFLTDDVGSDVDLWKKWISDPNNRWTNSNYSSLEKEGNAIRIWFECDYDSDDPNVEYFETTAEELNLILDKWKEVMEKLPAMVTITREDGIITFTYE